MLVRIQPSRPERKEMIAYYGTLFLGFIGLLITGVVLLIHTIGEGEELIHYIVGEFSEGDLERAIKAFKEGADLYDGAQTWKDALDTIRKEL